MSAARRLKKYAQVGLGIRRCTEDPVHLLPRQTLLRVLGQPKDISDLATHPRLIYGLHAGSGVWQMTKSDGIIVSVDGNRRLRFDSGEAIKDAAVEGMGIAFVPSFLAESDVLAKRLVKVLPEYQGNEIPIHAIYPNRKHLAAKVRLFIDMLVLNLQGR